MRPTWESGSVKLYCGNCLDVLPDIKKDRVAILSDPPYGCNNDPDYTRFTGGMHDGRDFGEPIHGDDQPFDPKPWLDFPEVVLWGYQYFAERLPVGTVLVWNKRRDNQLGTFLSDCELAWQKGGKGVYLFNHVWAGFDRQSERGKTLHPNQKPVALWHWVFSRLELPKDWTIFDGYMGSGSCGVAAVEAGYGYIGCEIDPGYFGVAQGRIYASQTEMIQETFI